MVTRAFVPLPQTVTPARGCFVRLSRTTPVSAAAGGNQMVEGRAVDRLGDDGQVPGGLDTVAERRVIAVIVALWIVGPSTPISTIRSRPMPVSLKRPSASVVTLAGWPGSGLFQKSLANRWFAAGLGSSRRSLR